MKKLLFIFLVLATLSSCKLKKTMAIFDYGQPTSERVVLIPSGQDIPDGYVMVGTCTYGEAGMTPTEICTYEAITRTAMDDARKIGAILVYVAHVVDPHPLGSTCYTITVHFYRKQ